MIRARVELEPRDLWVGVCWQRSRQILADRDRLREVGLWQEERLDVWICLVPCLPIHFVASWGGRRMSDAEHLAWMREGRE